MNMRKIKVKYISDKRSIFFKKGKLYDAYLPKDDRSGRFFAFYLEDMEEAGYYAMPASRFEVIENKAMNDMQMELNRLIQRVERKKVRAIEEQYGLELNDEAKRVFSMASDDPIFLGEDGSVRILSMDEILEASEDMEVDFASYQIIPIADVYDNDYIVYDAKNECWCMFNIVDEVKFGKEKNFIDCFDEDADDDDEDFDDEDFE